MFRWPRNGDFSLPEVSAGELRQRGQNGTVISAAELSRQIFSTRCFSGAPSYCKACFAAIAAEELPEDTARLDELARFWVMGEELKHKQGICSRCGKDGDVVSHEPTK